MSETIQVPAAETRIVNLRHLPNGWESDKNYVYIGRKGKGQDGTFGNPFLVGPDGNLETVLEKFRVYASGRLKADPDYRVKVRGLLGKTLVCFCAPEEGLAPADKVQCHGQILATSAEGLNSDSKYLLEG